MKLLDLVNRPAPRPWAEDEKIPWDEPSFSARMLREHLSQAHDAASRRAPLIDRHVDWIHRTLLGEQPAAILDLACGPGLYASRLARLGHRCVGIDFSPASIEHARAEAKRDGLACTFQQRDLREGGYGEGFDLALLVFGELNAFRPDEARAILAAARSAVRPGGALVIEVHTRASLEKTVPLRSWYTAREGLFADHPHLCLKESSWHAEQRARVDRYYVIDESGDVRRYGVTAQAYEPDEYRELLHGAGFDEARLHPALDGGPGSDGDDLFVWVAR